MFPCDPPGQSYDDVIGLHTGLQPSRHLGPETRVGVTRVGVTRVGVTSQTFVHLVSRELLEDSFDYKGQLD